MPQATEKILPVVKVIEAALVSSPIIEIVTVEHGDGWGISVRDVNGNDLWIEVKLQGE